MIITAGRESLGVGCCREGERGPAFTGPRTLRCGAERSDARRCVAWRRAVLRCLALRCLT